MSLRIIPLLLLLTTILACANPNAHRSTLRRQTHSAEQPPAERLVTLRDAEGVEFQIPSQMLCEEMPERIEGTLIVAFRFPIFSEEHDQLAYYVRVVGTQGQTLALGFFRIHQGMNTCYLRLSRGKTVDDIQDGIVRLRPRRHR